MSEFSHSSGTKQKIVSYQEDIDRQMRFIGRCRSNFTFAAKVLLNVDLAIPQKAMIHAMRWASFIMIIAGRGLGKTFTMAVYACLKAMLFPDEKIGIISYSYRQAKFVFGYISTIYGKSPALRASCVQPPTIGADSCWLRLKNGSFIQALPLGDGEKIRGARFYTLLLDEAVKVPEEIIETAVFPMMNVKKDPMKEVRRQERKAAAEAAGLPFDEPEPPNNQIIMCTTAWFQFSYLYKKMVEWKEQMFKGNKDYAVLEFTYLDAPKGYLSENIIELSRETMSPVRFAMENMAYWPPDTEGFFPRSLFENARGNHTIQMHGTKDQRYVMAIDPAREKDNISIQVAKIGDISNLKDFPHRLVYIESISPKTINTMADPNGNKFINYRVRQVYEAFSSNGAQVVAIGLDKGGGGSALRDALADNKYEIPDSAEFGEDAGKIVPCVRLLQTKGQNDQHDKIFENSEKIIDLISFSSEWINPAAWHLIDYLKTRSFLLPVPNRNGDDERFLHNETPKRNEALTREDLIELSNVPVDIRDEKIEEIENMIDESTSIVATPLPTKKGFFRFDTLTSGGKKDRWAALLILTQTIYDIENSGRVPSGYVAEEGELAITSAFNSETREFTDNSRFSKHYSSEAPKVVEVSSDPISDVRYSEDAALG